jgi:hypothetical protein
MRVRFRLPVDMEVYLWRESQTITTLIVSGATQPSIQLAQVDHFPGDKAA